MNRTKSLRTNDDPYLLISFTKPHKHITAQTIGRWLKNLFNKSGIDSTIFSGHSARHSSTSAAHRAGINIETIRKTAGWSSNSQTFANFYNRPVTSRSNFANAVLLNNSE